MTDHDDDGRERPQRVRPEPTSERDRPWPSTAAEHYHQAQDLMRASRATTPGVFPDIDQASALDRAAQLHLLSAIALHLAPPTVEVLDQDGAAYLAQIMDGVRPADG